MSGFSGDGYKPGKVGDKPRTHGGKRLGKRARKAAQQARMRRVNSALGRSSSPPPEPAPVTQMEVDDEPDTQHPQSQLLAKFGKYSNHPLEQ
eukprot:COSAG01_NODE_3816_length_5670_cov_8.691079_1_plen_92_part_00